MARTNRAPAVGFIFITLVLIILGFGIVIPVLPQIVTGFEGGSDAGGARSYGWLVGVFALMQFVASPILGALSDRFGRRKVLLVALAGSAIDYVIMGWAPSMTWLFVARVISGLTAGAFATCNAYIADVTPPEKRAQGFGLVGAAWGLGFVLGPAIGGLLGQGNPHRPFFAAAICVALNFIFGLFILPESLPKDKRRAFSWKRANPVGALIAISKLRGVLDLAGMFFIYMLGTVMLQSIWVLYTHYRYGWGPRDVGLSLMFVGVLAAVVQGGLTKPILGRIGERRGIVLGLLLTSLAMTGYGLSTLGWMVFPVAVISSFGGLCSPSAQSLITKHVPVDQQGAVQGALAGLTSLASIFAPLISTWSFAKFISPEAPFHLHVPGISFFEAAAMMLLALVLAVRSFRLDDEIAAGHRAPMV